MHFTYSVYSVISIQFYFIYNYLSAKFTKHLCSIFFLCKRKNDFNFSRISRLFSKTHFIAQRQDYGLPEVKRGKEEIQFCGIKELSQDFYFPMKRIAKNSRKKKYFFHFQSIWFDRSYFSVNPAFSRIHILWKNLLKVLGFPIIYKLLLIVFKRFFFPNHILNLFYLICICSN